MWFPDSFGRKGEGDMTEKQIQTPNDAIEALSAIDHGDKEVAHSQADRILLDLLSAQGMQGVAHAYEQCKKRVGGFWYA
jgi:hypothetical protein